MKWTPDMDAMLKSLIETRHSAATAAVAFSREHHIPMSRHTVIGRAYRKGWSFDSESKRARVTLSEPKALRHKPRPARLSRAIAFNPTDFGARKPRAKSRPETSAPCEPAPIGPMNDFPIWGCRWIHGDPVTEAWQCCAVPTLPHSSYCAHHEARTQSLLTKHQKGFSRIAKLVWAA